ncbi:MAG: Fe(3+) ABC transporter substrate-binding protein [Alphaproteobacteria bacterium]|nr:Fe(3+) ABC transporter substrate-binding protein [Alphaproteobacteria bacterium]
MTMHYGAAALSRITRWAGLGGLALLLAACSGEEAATPASETDAATPPAGQEVNIYSYRQEVLIRPLLEAFTEETGIEVNLLSGSADALLERLIQEGQNSPADILLTADAGRLIQARKAEVLQPFESEVVQSVVPLQYRDPENRWVGLSVRARTIFYARERVDPAQLSTYGALADDMWEDRICIRSSTNIYNQSMLAALMAHHGKEWAESWANSMVENFARTPQGGDRDQIKALAAGECDVAVANTYYYGRMLAEPADTDERQAAEKVGLFWANQDSFGTHVNISGAGVTASARNRENAIKLIEFLLSENAQRIYAQTVFEYPVRSGVEQAEIVKAWGPFKPDDLPLSTLAEYQIEAVKIFDRAGWP